MIIMTIIITMIVIMITIIVIYPIQVMAESSSALQLRYLQVGKYFSDKSHNVKIVLTMMENDACIDYGTIVTQLCLFRP